MKWQVRRDFPPARRALVGTLRVLVLLVLAPSVAPSLRANSHPIVPGPSSAGYQLARSVLAMGGGPKASAGYHLWGTAGQTMGVGRLDGAGYQVYSYTLGERTVIYPSGAARTYQFDALNRLDAVKTGGETLADQAYDVSSRFSTVAYNNGLTNRVDYNPLGWIEQTRVYTAGGNLVDYRYGYDDVGNRTYTQRYHKANQPSDVYRYDGLYQLVDAWYGADATDPASITAYDLYQTYDLDPLGNRLVVSNDGAGQSYGPQSGGRLTNPMNRYETVDAAALAYDVRGNTLDDGINSYAYDVLNRQTVVTNTAAITTEYIYDARGRRVAKVTAGITVTHYFYDIQYRVLEERDGSGQLLALYTYGTGIVEPLTMERGGQTYYYHRDALGSITELSDSSGAIVERYEYDVYGAVTIYDGAWITRTASAVSNPYLFTGRRFDPESGNYYYRARVYSPALGRFLNMDPLGFVAGDDNLYRYVGNNPAKFTDPSGHSECANSCRMTFHPVSGDIAVRDVGDSALYWLIALIASGQSSAEERLLQILKETQGVGQEWIPRFEWDIKAGEWTRTHFQGIGGIPGDIGFAQEFRDDYLYTSVWGYESPESRQVGHFLTAVDMGYHQGWLYTIVAHELYPDPGLGVIAQLLQPILKPAAYRSNIRDAIEADEAGDCAARDRALSLVLNEAQLGAVAERQGNSMEDLRLSVRGWRLGFMVANGMIKTNKELANWIALYVAGGY